MYQLKMDGYQCQILIEALAHIQETYLNHIDLVQGDCTDESQGDDLAKLIQRIKDLKERK